ncbi:hypothetical protein DICVIV_03129 [Dictyocaulus viviparus]|uniref:Piwi domain-containing protein n=1 Tax=Dictyocaulus viviparus TaxID=29172 RepID=A0A0D8Y3X4_DICVI|nr:hypothetical protein DICVIV_03129 [Dictyocaulus viviparus]
MRRLQTLENVLLKFNVKCGGLNHIVTPSVTTLSNKTTQQDMNGRLFSGKMFVGFGLSHAAAQNLYDRQNEATVKEPTVVGLAYSTGFCTDYAGCWWYQQPRLHNILYIEDHFEKAFTTYYQTKQSLPTEVIIYRSGTSDSELPEVGEKSFFSILDISSENFEASSSCPLKTSVDNEDSADIFYQRISRDLMNSLPNHYFA